MVLGVWGILRNFAYCKRLPVADGKVGMQISLSDEDVGCVEICDYRLSLDCRMRMVRDTFARIWSRIDVDIAFPCRSFGSDCVRTSLQEICS